jgi:hypothetical protein
LEGAGFLRAAKTAGCSGGLAGSPDVTARSAARDIRQGVWPHSGMSRSAAAASPVVCIGESPIPRFVEIIGAYGGIMLRALLAAIGTLVMRSVPVVAIVVVAGFWTGWFSSHPGTLAALLFWVGLLLLEIWIEYRRWRAKRVAARARSV